MKRGLVKIQGFGINDANYAVSRYERINGKSVIVWSCPFYERWTDIIYRCYSEVALKKHPTYKGCTVCNEWSSFMNFRKWMEGQDWEGKYLDKDFLIEGNKVYSPDNCIFLTNKVNCFISARGAARGDSPLGVSYYKWRDKYLARCSNGDGKNIHLGYFTDPLVAHKAWQRKKLEICTAYLEEFKEEPLITKGLTRIKDKILFHIENNLELTSF